MANKIIFQLGENPVPGGVERCVSLIEPSTKVRFNENDHLVLLPHNDNKSVVTVLLDDPKSKDLFVSPPAKVNLLPKSVSAGSIDPPPVDNFKLSFRKDLDGAERRYRFRTQPSARCSDLEVTDVIVEC